MGSLLSMIPRIWRGTLAEVTNNRRVRRDPLAEVTNNKEPPLEALPVEILQYISTSFLPCDAAASLSVCSRSMLNTVGARALPVLRLEVHKSERAQFLKTLERDLPKWIFCHHCSVLHPISEDENPYQGLCPQFEPQCVRRDGFVSVGFMYHIRYEHAQRLMRNYRLGKDYKKSLQKLSVSVAHPSEYWHGGTIKAEIVPDELVLRIKHTIRLPKNRNVYWIRTKIGSLCPHDRKFSDKVFTQAFQCALNHRDGLPCVECQKQKCCPECSTSLHVDLGNPKNRPTVVQVNVSRNLGSCESPFDLKWRKQADPYRSSPCDI